MAETVVDDVVDSIHINSDSHREFLILLSSTNGNVSLGKRRWCDSKWTHVWRLLHWKMNPSMSFTDGDTDWANHACNAAMLPLSTERNDFDLMKI